MNYNFLSAFLYVDNRCMDIFLHEVFYLDWIKPRMFNKCDILIRCKIYIYSIMLFIGPIYQNMELGLFHKKNLLNKDNIIVYEFVFIWLNDGGFLEPPFFSWETFLSDTRFVNKRIYI